MPPSATSRRSACGGSGGVRLAGMARSPVHSYKRAMPVRDRLGVGVLAASFPALLGGPAALGVRLAVAADLAALLAGGVRLLLAPAGTGLLAAAGFLVDGRPGPPLGLLLG